MKENGLMLPNEKAAAEIAQMLHSIAIGNAVILTTEDERAIALAVDLAGATGETCKIGARCRVSQPPLLTPTIYVACLAAYNLGILHGWWIDATQDEDAIAADIEEMLAASPVLGAEEWAIHDFDNFGSIRISERESLETVSRWAQLIGENPNEQNAIAHYIKFASERDIEISAEDFSDRYCGYWSNPKEFALKSEVISELYQWDKFAKDYPFWSEHIDWEYLGQELEMRDDFYYSEAASGIYVFREG